MKKDLKKGIAAIRKEFHLLPLSKWNYKEYKIYGWQISETKDLEAKQQAGKLSAFLDLFENSIR